MLGSSVHQEGDGLPPHTEGYPGFRGRLLTLTPLIFQIKEGGLGLGSRVTRLLRAVSDPVSSLLAVGTLVFVHSGALPCSQVLSTLFLSCHYGGQQLAEFFISPSIPDILPFLCFLSLPLLSFFRFLSASLVPFLRFFPQSLVPFLLSLSLVIYPFCLFYQVSHSNLPEILETF